ncbi:MAG TPA: TraB/GumN family protein, partial [Steroidobacteraceae bacterium]|nr:TraB/GumN family protein [Steroidobacteraceae bacterium]
MIARFVLFGLAFIAPLALGQQPSEGAVAVEPEDFTGVSETTILDEVLVTGEHPGPKLWKVSKDGHALWILGTYGPLPKKMTWRSQEVASIISESQRVIGWVNIDTDIDVGFFAGLAALPSLINVGNNPDGAKLKEVVPPDLYAKWLPLKEKHFGRDKDIEELRPSFAALRLRYKAQ